MVISEELAARAAALLRADQPERLTGAVLWRALCDAERAFLRNAEDQEMLARPPYARRSAAAEAMDDPRYVHGLGR